MQPFRLGILGGSFNPVHIGHIRLALEAKERLGLDQVDLVPAAWPPHKSEEGMLPFDLRCHLLSCAIPRGLGLSLSELEGVLPKPSYTCNTLAEYRKLLPDAELFFILGEKDLYAVPSWLHGLELADMANFAVAVRAGESSDLTPFVREHFPEAVREDGKGGIWRLPSGRRLVPFPIPFLGLCATMIRKRWNDGRALDCLVPRATLAAMSRMEAEISLHWGPRGR